MLADKKSQSPDKAPSGVRHDMLVAFMTWCRYSLGSLQQGQFETEGKRTQNLRDSGGDVDAVLPLELCPHASELRGCQIPILDASICVHTSDSVHDEGLM